MAKRFGFMAALTLVAATAHGQDVKISAGPIEDGRQNNERMSALSIELKVEGDGAVDVQAMRIKVKSAKDDLGTNLVKPSPDGSPPAFEEFGVNRSPKPKIRLASPARAASKVDVTGEVELFIPKKDPNTSLKLDRFQAALDKPISNAALKSAKVTLTPLSAKEYVSRQAKNKPTKEQMIAEGKKRGATDDEIKQMLALMEAFSKMGSEPPDEKSVLLETKDPEGRIMDIQVAAKGGEEIHSNGRGSSGSDELKLRKIDLTEKAPADAVLVVTLRTPKSVVTVPISMKEVNLP